MFGAIKLKELDTMDIFRVIDAQHKFPNHFHETYCLSLIENGVFVENGIIAKAGTLLISNPFEVHNNSLYKNFKYSLTTFYINKEIFDFALSTDESLHFEKIIDNNYLFNELNGVKEQYLSNKPIEKSLINFIRKVFIYATKEQEKQAPAWLEEAQFKIKSNIDLKLNLQELANLACLDKFKYVREFKKWMGLTPFQYIVLNRVHYAQELLKQGQSIASAALEAGFYDQSHLTHYFRSYVGITPGKYKRDCNILQELE